VAAAAFEVVDRLRDLVALRVDDLDRGDGVSSPDVEQPALAGLGLGR